MNRLPDDYTRCYGHNCELRLGCLRLTTIARDVAFDAANIYRVRSYSANLTDTISECRHYIEDPDAQKA